MDECSAVSEIQIPRNITNSAGWDGFFLNRRSVTASSMGMQKANAVVQTDGTDQSHGPIWHGPIPLGPIPLGLITCTPRPPAHTTGSQVTDEIIPNPWGVR